MFVCLVFGCLFVVCSHKPNAIVPNVLLLLLLLYYSIRSVCGKAVGNVLIGLCMVESNASFVWGHPGISNMCCTRHSLFILIGFIVLWVSSFIGSVEVLPAPTWGLGVSTVSALCTGVSSL